MDGIENPDHGQDMFGLGAGPGRYSPPGIPLRNSDAGHGATGHGVTGHGQTGGSTPPPADPYTLKPPMPAGPQYLGPPAHPGGQSAYSRLPKGRNV